MSTKSAVSCTVCDSPATAFDRIRVWLSTVASPNVTSLFLMVMLSNAKPSSPE